MSVEIIDWMSASLVLLGPGLLASDEEVSSFASAYSPEIEVGQVIAESGAGRRLALNRDRISIDLFPQRSVIKQDYPPPNDLSRFTEAILNATQISCDISGIRAHGYNVEFLFTQTEYPTVYEYIAKKVLTGFRAPDGNIVGAMVQFRFRDADGQMWNIDIQPRLRKDDATAGYCSVNLHLPSPPDLSKTVIFIAAVHEKAKSFVAELAD